MASSFNTSRDVVLLVSVMTIAISCCCVSIPDSFGKAVKEVYLKNASLSAEVLFKGKLFPTGMVFLSSKDILITDKDSGKVFKISNGKMVKQPLIDVNVANESERGLLGIALANRSDEDVPPFVFLYYTETRDRDGGDVLGNRLYRYELLNGRLENPKLLLDLPTRPGPSHNGGVLRIGPDKDSIYLVIGDLNRSNNRSFYTEAQNIKGSAAPDGRGGILRLTFDGGVVNDEGIIGEEHPLDKYYAYGLRNSFGITFDPITGNLWDTENGGNYGDELNLVYPGFNGGYRLIQGIAYLDDTFDPKKLVTFDGKGKYSDPEFEWLNTSAPTVLSFFNSDKLGKEYENDLFVASIHNGTIFNFDLNSERTELKLSGPLEDKIANTDEELEGVIFGHRFGIPTHIEVGPDGYLYILSFYYRNTGMIYKIAPVVGGVKS